MVQSCKSQRPEPRGQKAASQSPVAVLPSRLCSARYRGLFAGVPFPGCALCHPRTRSCPQPRWSRGRCDLYGATCPQAAPRDGAAPPRPGPARSSNGPYGPFPPPSRGGGRRGPAAPPFGPSPAALRPPERCQGPAAPRPCGQAAAPQGPPSSGTRPGRRRAGPVPSPCLPWASTRSQP